MFRVWMNVAPRSPEGRPPSPLSGKSATAVEHPLSAADLEYDRAAEEAQIAREFGRSPAEVREAAFPQYDPFRHSALRMVGYVWYLAKGFEYVFPRRVLSYSRAITCIYVAADPLYKVEQMNDHMYSQQASVSTTLSYDLAVIQETLCWQLLATVAVPMALGVPISKFMEAVAPKIASPHVARYLPGVARLLAAGVFIPHVDRAIDWVVGNTVRPVFDWTLPRVHDPLLSQDQTPPEE